MLTRNDIEGEDEELSDMEEFYLTEIEQIQNSELVLSMQREEGKIRE